MWSNGQIDRALNANDLGEGETLVSLLLTTRARPWTVRRRLAVDGGLAYFTSEPINSINRGAMSRKTSSYRCTSSFRLYLEWSALFEKLQYGRPLVG